MYDWNDKQRAVVEFWQAYNVPTAWFYTRPDEHGQVEAIALGAGFIWSIAIDRHGDASWSEAQISEFTIGITI